MSPVEKISAYDLIVTFVPGVLLLEALRASGLPVVGQSNIPTYAALSYVLGLLSSRAGSFLVGPLGQNFSKESHEYSEFVEAEAKDGKIATLLQTANGYRSIVGGTLVYFLLLLALNFAIWFKLSESWSIGLAVAAIGVLFFFSYQKQRLYITRRIRRVLDGDG